MKNLENILLENKHCTQEEIDQALSIQMEYGGQIGNILLNLGTISDKTLIETIVQQYSLKLFSEASIDKLERLSIDNININFLNEDIYEGILKSIENSFDKETLVGIYKDEKLNSFMRTSFRYFPIAMIDTLWTRTTER